jgi:hypothetical protein
MYLLLWLRFSCVEKHTQTRKKSIKTFGTNTRKCVSLQSNQKQRNTMKTSKEQKERILAIAEEIQETNDIKNVYRSERDQVIKSWFTCIREAINYKEPKQSNKLSERSANYHESRNERYNYNTKSFIKY